MEHCSGVKQSVTYTLEDKKTSGRRCGFSSLLSELKIALALIVNLFPIMFFPTRVCLIQGSIPAHTAGLCSLAGRDCREPLGQWPGPRSG